MNVVSIPQKTKALYLFQVTLSVGSEEGGFDPLTLYVVAPGMEELLRRVKEEITKNKWDDAVVMGVVITASDTGALMDKLIMEDA